LFREDWKGQRLTGRQVDGRLVPYPTRSEIDAGALAGKGSELLWVDDAVDAFFLHVQGSGRVVMENGQLVRLGFAGRNGHPYVAIGRELISRGAIPRERMSMQAIRAWLKANPGEASEVMALNPSFIFFRIIDGEGPIGAEGVPLTPGRSLAVDPAFVPLGLPIWLDTTDPLKPEQPLRRLVVAQDTGSAIKGPVRGDLFWGFGETAAAKAGSMNQRGRYFLLLPRKAPAP
jgi:membrane-bound lytic murein transglycosylase A